MTTKKKALNELADWMLENNFKFVPTRHSLSICVNDAFDTEIIGIVNVCGDVTAGEIRKHAEKED